MKERPENERNKATVSNSLVVSSNDNLIHPDFLIHSNKQTDLQSTFIDDILKENEDLKAEIEHKTGNPYNSVKAVISVQNFMLVCHHGELFFLLYQHNRLLRNFH